MFNFSYSASKNTVSDNKIWHFDTERHGWVGRSLASYTGGPRINPFPDTDCTGIPYRVSVSPTNRSLEQLRPWQLSSTSSARSHHSMSHTLSHWKALNNLIIRHEILGDVGVLESLVGLQTLFINLTHYCLIWGRFFVRDDPLALAIKGPWDRNSVLIPSVTDLAPKVHLKCQMRS